MAIQRERHIMPTLPEIIHDLKGATIFSKLDLRSGHHQLLLHKDSRYITTFSTHKGLFQYKRLSFGINAAAEKFQDVIATAIGDIQNCKNISDDIIVYGKNTVEHDKALQKLLKRCFELGLTLNRQKCEFYTPRVIFYGWVFSGDGMKPDPAKINAKVNMQTPTNVSECHSLLGMTNYISRLIPGYADIVLPIRQLTKKDSKFEWGTAQQRVLKILKDKLMSIKVMAYFVPNKETHLHIDGSPTGLGAILSQDKKVISYASKALTAVKKPYSKIERESLALAWACQHFKIYLLGCHFSIHTDHKPLLWIFNNPQSKASTRIKKMETLPTML